MTRPNGWAAHAVEFPDAARPDVHQKDSPRHEHDRPDVKAAREAWFRGPARSRPRPPCVPRRDLALDRYGPHLRPPRGKRLRSSVPHGHWKTTTFVAGLRLSGLAAPFVLERSDQPRRLPDFRRARLVPGNSLPRRDRRDGQPRQPHRAGRRAAALPPARSPDFNPDRDGLLKAQGAAAQAAGAHCRGIVGSHRSAHRYDHAR